MNSYKVMVSEEDKDIAITTHKLTTAMLTFTDLCAEHEGKAVYLYRQFDDVYDDGEIFTNEEIIAVGNVVSSMRLEDCGMSVRAYYIARRAECLTAGDLAQECEDAIAENAEKPWSKFRNCGKRTWAEFKAICNFMTYEFD